MTLEEYLVTEPIGVVIPMGSVRLERSEINFLELIEVNYKEYRKILIPKLNRFIGRNIIYFICCKTKEVYYKPKDPNLGLRRCVFSIDRETYIY